MGASVKAAWLEAIRQAKLGAEKKRDRHQSPGLMPARLDRRRKLLSMVIGLNLRWSYLVQVQGELCLTCAGYPGPLSNRNVALLSGQPATRTARPVRAASSIAAITRMSAKPSSPGVRES